MFAVSNSSLANWTPLAVLLFRHWIAVLVTATDGIPVDSCRPDLRDRDRGRANQRSRDRAALDLPGSSPPPNCPAAVLASTTNSAIDAMTVAGAACVHP
jgi:hypothetical protein